MDGNMRYWLTALLGVACAAAVFILGLRRKGLRWQKAWLAMAAALAAGLVLGKLICCAARFQSMFSRMGVAALWGTDPTEFSFAGCCAGIVLALVWFARRWKQPVGEWLDCLAPGGLLAIAVARMAESWLGNRGLGEKLSDGHWMCFFPLAVQNERGWWMMAIFTLEALWALVCLAWLLVAARRHRGRKPGLLFENTLALLCVGQLVLELLASGSVFYSFVHIDQVICALVLLYYILRHTLAARVRGFKRWWPLIVYLLLVALNGVTQFALDKPYLFTQYLSLEAERWIMEHLQLLCYGLLVLASAGMLCCHRASVRLEIRD